MSSNLKAAIDILASETAVSSAEKTPTAKAPKAFLVTNGSQRSAVPVTRTVEAVLNFEFAQGSMPA